MDVLGESLLTALAQKLYKFGESLAVLCRIWEAVGVIMLIFFFFFLFRAISAAYGSSQARG